MILEYVDKHIMDNLTLEDIAVEFHYSKYYMERIFMEEIGSTTGIYAREYGLIDEVILKRQ